MRVIKTKFIGPTNTKGARVSATDGNGNRVVVPYHHEMNPEQAHWFAALTLCSRHRWGGRYIARMYENQYIFVQLAPFQETPYSVADGRETGA